MVHALCRALSSSSIISFTFSVSQGTIDGDILPINNSGYCCCVSFGQSQCQRPNYLLIPTLGKHTCDSIGFSGNCIPLEYFPFAHLYTFQKYLSYLILLMYEMKIYPCNTCSILFYRELNKKQMFIYPGW